MSSFTSKTVRDLYEAYNSVYVDKTELFLNNILDEVTDIINHFVNEGYDFSEYSWNELYESFLENVLEPELEEVESFITQLNESSEELTEEQIENLLEGPINPFPFLGGLLRKSPKITTSGGVTIPRPPTPKPTPGTGRPLRNPRQLELPVGQDKGTFQRIGDWVSSLSKTTTKVKSPASPPSRPPVSSSSRPPASSSSRPPASSSSRQPSGTPQRQQGWPSLGLRDKASRVVQALTPGPKVKGLVKYGGAAAAGLGGLTATAALPLSAWNWATGKPSGLQQASGYIQGATGDALRLGANALRSTGSPEAQGVYDMGTLLKQAGADTQASVERKKRAPLSGTPSQPQRPKKLFREGLSIENVISESPDWNSAPKPKGVAVLTLGTERKVFIPGLGWQFPATARRWARAQGYTDWNKIPNPPQPAKPAKPAQPAQPPATRQQPPAQPPATRQQPPAQPPATRQQPPAPEPQAPAPAPKPKTWDEANPRLAEVERLRAQQRAAGKSVFDKEFRTNVINPVMYNAGGRSVEASKKMYPDKPKPQTEETMNKEPFDLVLEYLISEGHTDTLDEALYVMMEMDPETIQSICNEELTGERKKTAERIMRELRPHGRPRKATNKKYGALSRVTRASEGSSEVGRTTQTSPTGRGGRMPKGSVKTGWDGDFQADRPNG